MLSAAWERAYAAGYELAEDKVNSFHDHLRFKFEWFGVPTVSVKVSIANPDGLKIHPEVFEMEVPYYCGSPENLFGEYELADHFGEEFGEEEHERLVESFKAAFASRYADHHMHEFEGDCVGSCNRRPVGSAARRPMAKRRF